MPNYNDAIESAKGVVMCEWDKLGGEVHMKLVLNIIGKLDELKRQTRAKRKAS